MSVLLEQIKRVSPAYRNLKPSITLPKVTARISFHFLLFKVGGGVGYDFFMLSLVFTGETNSTLIVSQLSDCC